MTTAAISISRTIHFAADNAPSAANTLAGEHALLMRDVTRRATPVLALLDAWVWPHAEIGTLIAFLRDPVLRQTSDEEALLYPHDVTASPFAELSADHARLHMLTDRLERVHAESCAAHDVRVLIGELLTTLQRHLAEEQAILAALPEAPAEVPSVAALAACERPWPSDAGPVLIPLDKLPKDYATQWCIERLLRLSPGQTAEVRSRNDNKLTQVSHWFHTFDPDRYGLAYAATGHEHSLEVTRRGAD